MGISVNLAGFNLVLDPPIEQTPNGSSISGCYQTSGTYYCSVWQKADVKTGRHTARFIVVTPTPYIQVDVKNTNGTLVNQTSYPTQLGRAMCDTDADRPNARCIVGFRTTTNTHTFPKKTVSGKEFAGAMLNVGSTNLKIIGITPAPAAGSRIEYCHGTLSTGNANGRVVLDDPPTYSTVSTTGANHDCYTWSNGSWLTGLRKVTYIVATPTPTPNTAPPWIKLKDSSFNSQDEGTFKNSIPASRTAYDTDDDASANFIMGVAGYGLFKNDFDLAPAGQLSTHDWALSNYQKRNNMTPSIFLSYVKARAVHNMVTSTFSPNLVSGKVNIIPRNADGTKAQFIVDNNRLADNSTRNGRLLSSAPLTLLVDGDITIGTGSGFNRTTPVSVALIATGKIIFNPTVTEAHGIFIAGEGFDIGTTTNVGLKIVGNLVSFEPGFINTRAWSPNTRPSLFVKFYPKYYLDLAPYISTLYYGYNQLQ